MDAVATGVPYHGDTTEEWLPPQLDVYAPADADGLPVVVMFHGGVAGAADKGYLRELAELTAAEGAVVFVPNHGTTHSLPPDPGDAARLAAKWIDEAACAVAFAVATAPEYGGDPDRLVVFGHSWGGTVASTVTLRGPRSFPACGVDPTPFAVDRLVAWDGDYLMMGASEPDQLWEGRMHEVLAEIAPWQWLQAGDDLEAAILTSARSPQEGYTRGYPDAEGDWLANRDPTGEHTEHFRRLGALEDDAVDVNEEAELLVDTMEELGYDVELTLLPESGHDWSSVAESDRRTLADVLVQDPSQ